MRSGFTATSALARDVGLTSTEVDLGQLIADEEGNPFYILQLLKAAPR